METVRIGEVATITRGVSYEKEQALKSVLPGYTTLLRANNIIAGQFTYEDLVFVPNELVSKDQFLTPGDIVITMSSGSKAHVGKVAIVKKDCRYTYGAFCAKITPDKVNPLYLYFALSDVSFRRHIETQCKGTNINNIKVSYILDYEIPFPPISEQERIVAQIEELFSQLDAGVETLKKTKAQLAVYRQAVLKEAFDSVKTYGTKNIEALCQRIVDCPHSTPKWSEEGYLCLRTTNFKRGYLDLSEKNYVTKETFDSRNIRLVPLPGDVLYSREGAILGIACIIPKDTYVCLGQRMMLLRPGEKLNNRYLMYFLNSPSVTNYVASITGGSASPHVNVGDIKAFMIPCPTIEIQQQLVLDIDSKFSVCDSIEQNLDTALQQAEAMRQSILKEAFEGKL